MGVSVSWGGANEKVEGIPGKAVQVSGGGHQCCVLNDSKDIYCWGNRNRGEEEYPPINFPRVESSDAVKMDLNLGTLQQLAVGGSFDCAARASGAVKCWGGEYAGFSQDLSEPLEITGFTAPVTQLSMAAQGACALQINSEVMCWKREEDFDGDATPFSGKASLSARLPEKIHSIATGSAHACALAESRSVYCWGTKFTEFGGPDSSHSLKVQGLSSPAVAMLTASEHAYALLITQRLACRGFGSRSQLGTDSPLR